jgi:hypothetical protein
VSASVKPDTEHEKSGRDTRDKHEAEPQAHLGLEDPAISFRQVQDEFIAEWAADYGG